MFIQILRPPVAGDIFRFSIAGGSGATSIEVYVNGRVILKRLVDSLPSRAVADIPANAAGTKLSISAIDEAGNYKSLEYVISEADPGPHSMLFAAQNRGIRTA